MTTNSKIEWTEQTWNPTVGCTKISPGCKHCYAEIMARRLQAMGTRGGGGRGRPSTGVFRQLHVRCFPRKRSVRVHRQDFRNYYQNTSAHLSDIN